MNRQDSRRTKILEIFSQHRKKDCLLHAKPYDNTRNINLFNNSDFFRCVKHLQNKHTSVFFTDSSAVFDVSLKEAKAYIAIIRRLNDLYFVDIEITKSLDKIDVSVSRLNSNTYSLRHEKYRIEFQHDNSVLAKFGKARLIRNVDNSALLIETTISGLKAFFGDIKNVRMTISMELFVTCNKCHDIIALSSVEAKYFMKSGWYCVTCAKNCVRTCGHVWQDCQFMDIEEKQKKHGLFFCFYRNMCFICRDPVRTENGGPIAHYRDKHQSITHLTEVIFRLKSTKHGEYCLLEHLTDLFVCRYHLDDDEFRFVIRTPWQYEQINEYRCYMTLTAVAKQPIDEQPDTKTYEMQRSTQCFDDWQIDLKKWTFKNWPSEFDVSVKLEQVPD